MISIITNMDSSGLSYAVAASLATALVFMATSWYYYLSNKYSYWSRRGVKGPKPSLVGGNVVPLIMGDRFQVEKGWFKEFGKVYGIYEGTKPALVVADTEVMRQICIKDFDLFVDHDMFEFTNKYQNNFIFVLTGDRWRRVRSIMSPTFTSGKIKRMFKLIDVCADDLVALFREQLDANNLSERKVVNLKNLYQMYTLDAIASCCYGLKLEREGSSTLKQAASRNDFVRIAMRLLDLNYKRILAMFIVSKPILRWMKFEFLPARQIDPLASKIERLIKSRKETRRKFDDYLQLLIDAKADDKMELSELDAEENHHAGLTHDTILSDHERMSKLIGEKSLSNQEIISNATFLMVVGLETTANLLTYCTYALAFHQDIQERLYRELSAMAKYEESDDDKGRLTFDYDMLTSYQYLDSVLSETLRRFTPAIMSTRTAKSDYFIEKYNLHVAEGTKILLQLHLIMNDPDNWDQPTKFDPERFMPGQREKIPQGAYCPFGLGPRHCIGMRFSLTEAKLGMAKMIMSYKFEPVAEISSFPPPCKANLFGLTCVKTPLINLRLR